MTTNNQLRIKHQATPDGKAKWKAMSNAEKNKLIILNKSNSQGRGRARDLVMTEEVTCCECLFESILHVV